MIHVVDCAPPPIPKLRVKLTRRPLTPHWKQRSMVQQFAAEKLDSASDGKHTQLIPREKYPVRYSGQSLFFFFFFFERDLSMRDRCPHCP
jgi:hypothetical protein